MTDDQERTERPEGSAEDGGASRPVVRLSPPPRVGEGRGVGYASREAAEGRGLRYWLTAIMFALLGTVAVAVFVLLPRWVPSQAEATGEGAAAVTAAPEEVEAGAADIAVPKTDNPATDTPEHLASPSATPSPVAAQSRDSVPALPESQSESRTEARPAPSEAAPSEPSRVPQPGPGAAAFSAAMAEGLTALDRKDLEAAQGAFERALALSPASPEATEGMSRVRAAQQIVAIADHREKAAALEESERWGEAATEYAAVLALDPSIRFARERHEIAKRRHELDQKLEAHIARPDRLSSDQVLDEARDLVSDARTTQPSGPVLKRQIETLSSQIDTASTPIRVVLLSDETTQVLVYRVGRLGTFERKELELRPGTYTVVGTRPGFQDVRLDLEVTPGGTPSLTIRCEEEI